MSYRARAIHIQPKTDVGFLRKNGILKIRRFDRPGFLAMMEEVEAGREAIVKQPDAMVQVMEVLRQRGVRLIAINESKDSLKGDDDFTPFRNIAMNFTPVIPAGKNPLCV